MTKEDQQQEKHIRRGDHQNRYLIYVRKSTDDEDIQKNSLKFQKQEVALFAQRQKLDIADVTLPGFATAGIIAEKHSAFKVDDDFEITKAGKMVVKIERPKFRRLLFYLKRGHFKGVIIYCWDRSCRNDGDEVAIKRLIQDGVDIRFVATTYETSSSGALHMDVEGMFAKHHSRLTSEKVTAVTRQLRAKGICTYQAPVGYLNTGKSDHKPFDPERKDLVTGLFKKMASGDWTLSALERWAKDVGLTMPPARRRRSHAEILADEDDETETLPKITRPMTVANIHKILTNRFYVGLVMGPSVGEWVKSISHEPLISQSVFADVQKRLSGRCVSTHYQTVLELPYRKFVRCAICRRVYTPYTKKGHVYFGARCRRDCTNRHRSLSVAGLEEQIRPIIARLAFTPEELAEFDVSLQTDISTTTKQQQVDVAEIERRKKRVRADLTYLRDNRLTLLKSGIYTVDTYVAEETKLTADLQDRLVDEQLSDQAMHETMQEVSKVSELLKTVAQHFETAKSSEREQFARILFSELFVSETSLKPSLTTGLAPFKDRLLSVCDPITWISELSAFRAEIRECSHVLSKMLSKS